MTKRPNRYDFARVRVVLQREDNAGQSFEEAVRKAAAEQPGAFKRILEWPEVGNSDPQWRR